MHEALIEGTQSGFVISLILLIIVCIEEYIKKLKEKILGLEFDNVKLKKELDNLKLNNRNKLFSFAKEEMKKQQYSEKNSVKESLIRDLYI